MLTGIGEAHDVTIADFNRRNIVSPGLLEEFAASGNPLIDRLWNKPAGSTKQRHRIAVGLYETLLAGNRFDPIALLHRAIRALPIDWDRYPFPYRHRRLRGRSAAWADATLALLIRMPLADVMDGSARHGQARSVIAACLRELLWATNVDGLDHDRYLASRMAMIVEVVEWYARHDPRAKKDIGIAMSPLMTYLWERRAGGLIPGAVRDAVDRLYLFLDGHLDICEDTQGAWPSIHEYCLKALGIPEQQSIVWRLQDDMPELVNGFRRSLSRRTGEEVAELLLSDREFDIAELCRGKDPVDVLLRLLRARALWQGVVGLGHENSYDVLHRALNRLPNWRGLNELIRDASAVDAPVRDAQMSELVRSLSDAGATIAEQIVPRALSCVRTGGFPLTRQALEDLPAAEATAVVPFFDQTLRAVRQGLGRQ